jgi:lipoprotein LprG
VCRPLTRPVLVLCAAVLASGVVSGCTGNGSAESAQALGERLRTAKQTLDQAASIDLTLRAERLPPQVDGIREAAGVATHTPAFRGRITIAASGLFDGQTVQVVAVGGRVYAQTPFSSSFIRVDPADFNAPDPAALMSADTGLSTLLTQARGLSSGGEERDGEQVLTSVSGEVPGEAVARTFPSAAAARPFDATFWVDGDDRLRRAELTGPFYSGSPPVTYELTLEASDRRVEITPP